MNLHLINQGPVFDYVRGRIQKGSLIIYGDFYYFFKARMINGIKYFLKEMANELQTIHLRASKDDMLGTF